MTEIELTKRELADLQREFNERYKEVQDFGASQTRLVTFMSWVKNYHKPRKAELENKIKRLQQ